jgi:hypothetical protein
LYVGFDGKLRTATVLRSGAGYIVGDTCQWNIIKAYTGTTPSTCAFTFPKFAIRYIQAEAHMIQVWAISSILQIRGVAFSTPCDLEHMFHCLPNHSDLRRVSG